MESCFEPSMEAERNEEKATESETQEHGIKNTAIKNLYALNQHPDNDFYTYLKVQKKKHPQNLMKTMNPDCFSQQSARNLNVRLN